MLHLLYTWIDYHMMMMMLYAEQYIDMAMMKALLGVHCILVAMFHRVSVGEDLVCEAGYAQWLFYVWSVVVVDSNIIRCYMVTLKCHRALVGQAYILRCCGLRAS